jgi:hypothetical protein
MLFYFSSHIHSWWLTDYRQVECKGNCKGHSKSNASCLFPQKLQQKKGCTIMPLDRASFQLQNTTLALSHYHCLCIFIIDNQEPACCACKNLHKWKRPTFSQLQWQLHCLLKCFLHSLSFIGPNRWKSEGAKSGLYGGCGRTLQPNFATCSMSLKLAWGLALSCCRRYVIFFSGLTLEIQASSLVSVRVDGLCDF